MWYWSRRNVVRQSKKYKRVYALRRGHPKRMSSKFYSCFDSLPQCPQILTFYRQKLTIASAFSIPLSPSLVRTSFMDDPLYLGSRHILRQHFLVILYPLPPLSASVSIGIPPPPADVSIAQPPPSFLK